MKRKTRKGKAILKPETLLGIQNFTAEIEHDRETRFFIISIPVMEHHGKRLFEEFTKTTKKEK